MAILVARVRMLGCIVAFGLAFQDASVQIRQGEPRLSHLLPRECFITCFGHCFVPRHIYSCTDHRTNPSDWCILHHHVVCLPIRGLGEDFVELVDMDQTDALMLLLLLETRYFKKLYSSHLLT